MPSYKVHLLGGAATFLLLLELTRRTLESIKPEHILLFAVVSAIGSLFPDIDINSKIQHYFYVTVPVFLLVLIFTKLWGAFFLVAGACLLIPTLAHRTMTHHPLFVTGIPGLVALYLTHQHNFDFTFTFATYLFFSAAALSHILFDRTLTAIQKPFKKK